MMLSMLLSMLLLFRPMMDGSLSVDGWMDGWGGLYNISRWCSSLATNLRYGTALTNYQSSLWLEGDIHAMVMMLVLGFGRTINILSPLESSIVSELMRRRSAPFFSISSRLFYIMSYT